MHLKNLLSYPLIQSLVFWVLFMLSLFLSYFLGSFLPQPVRPFALGIFGTLFAFIITRGALRLTHEKLRDTGLTWQVKTLPRFFMGFLTGALVFALILAGIVGFTSRTLINVPAVDLWDAVLLSSVALIPQAWMEEIAFRGWTLTKLKRSYGTRLTIYAGAVAFALYHYIPGGDLPGSFLGPGIWGVVFGLLAVWSGGIALPTGFHFALTFSLAVFGMKEPYAPIWNLVERNRSSYFSFDMDLIGLWTQLLVFVVSVILVEILVRRTSKLQ